MKADPFLARHSSTCGCCFVVPINMLRRLSVDPNIPRESREKFQATFVQTESIKTVRDANRVAVLASRTSAVATTPATAALAHSPRVKIFDCEQTKSLPGELVSDPQGQGDEAARTVYEITKKVVEFYKTVLGRNSIDGEGLDLVSSVHYGQNYVNAQWNGQQMIYGDGDADVFTEFWRSPDLIAHEITHGVTQYQSGLRYSGESGALNESISDVIGVSFHQWLKGLDASNAGGWLFGAGTVGPSAAAAGKTCFRDMLDPGADHALSPQPSSYRDFNPAGDVHDNSGIPNRAFSIFAQTLGGNAWEQALKVWYTACSDRTLASSATFSDFARLTVRSAHRLGGDQLADKVSQAWDGVDVPLAEGVA